MSEIVEHAESILGWHERHGRSLSRLLRPGLGAEEIERVEAMLGFPLPDDLRDLHVWRDGTDVEKATTLGRAYFFFGEYLLSIEEALEHREIGIEVAEWNRRWVPVFADGGGGFHVVDCRSKHAGAPVLWLTYGGTDRVAYYEDLTAMFETLRASFEFGAFFVCDDGSLSSNQAARAEIAMRLNPGLEGVWRSFMKS